MAEKTDGDVLRRVRPNQKEGAMPDGADGGSKPKRVVKPGYPFTPKESSLLAEGAALAKAYGITFNQLLTFLVENAVEEWVVPYMHKRDRTGEEADKPANEGVFKK